MSNQNDKPEGRTVVGTVPPKEDVLSMVGEGIHTGLRKGSDSKEGAKAWNAISDMPDWSDALGYFLWGLRYSGWEIVKVDDDLTHQLSDKGGNDT